ncbi:hypothetical protein [Peribacillus glennii]|uniref:Uncharacterized protein n=1 Tax=Peribacillus glennii TaxID=2303991 RepID=A0A372L7C7_9BACI|nr:hypothetical protein [Peribacillus glennii]RFU61146.1 hypothetical protein D0466_19400 [Peribacillus glennii]
MRPRFNFKSTTSTVAKAPRNKSSETDRKPKKLAPKRKDMNNAHLLSQSVLNFAKAAFVLALTVIFVVLACLGKIDTEFFYTLVGSFSPFL